MRPGARAQCASAYQINISRIAPIAKYRNIGYDITRSVSGIYKHNITQQTSYEIALIASAELSKVAESSPANLLIPETAQTLLTHAKHAALAGSWANQAPTVKINLGATASVPLTMEAEIVTDAQLPEDDILAGF